MIDKDFAEQYEVETKVLKQALSWDEPTKTEIKNSLKIFTFNIKQSDKKVDNSISKELISHQILLEEKHQSKEFAYIKGLLIGNEIRTSIPYNKNL